MILFAGIPSEPPMAKAIAAAERRQVPFRFFNPRHASDSDVRLMADGPSISAKVWIAGEAIELNACSGVYARSIDPNMLPEFQRAKAGGNRELAQQIDNACVMFDHALDCATTLVVNRPSAMASNFSKPAQLRAIASAGLLVPPTIVTNDPAAVQEFRAKHGRVIFKSISAARSIVHEWTAEGGPSLERIRALPVQFQALILGEDIRVHVIGNRLKATRILSAAIDYRYDSSTAMEPFRLPPSVAQSCLDLASSLDLAFAGIDLRRTRDRRFYCFEVNPSPAYSYFEDHGRQSISVALVELLSNGTR